MKRASIIGFGDVRRGDLCVGSCVIEALEQEKWQEAIRLAYVGDNPRDADLWLYDIDLAIIVGAAHIGGRPGEIRRWDIKTFTQNSAWFAKTCKTAESLVGALLRAQIAGGFPEDVVFLWIEPGNTAGLGMSKEVRKAFRRSIRIIKENLVEKGLLPETCLKVIPIYRLEVPRMVA
jgi:hydrogenase maturation protease